MVPDVLCIFEFRFLSRFIVSPDKRDRVLQQKIFWAAKMRARLHPTPSVVSLDAPRDFLLTLFQCSG